MHRKNKDITRIFRKVFIATVFLYATEVQSVSSAVSTCGGTLAGRTGTFTSPNYPYPPKTGPNAFEVRSSLSSDDEDIVTCEWKILGPEGLGIQLNFGDFDMAAGLDDCDGGELEVLSGVGAKRKSLDKYCGNDDLDTVQLDTNSATVIFRRPIKFSGRGILASFIATNIGETIDDFVTCADRGSDHVGVGSYSVLCPGGCANTTLDVWGKDAYRDNSYLCKAAVHSGVISDRFGGRVNVKRVPGDTLYFGSEANGVTTSSGAMSDFKLQFVNPYASCNSEIIFQENQLTASSYWTSDRDPDKSKWKPSKGILGKQVDAWSPNNPTISQWLEVDLREIKVITGISTRGSSSNYYTAKSYRVAVRNDTRSPWSFYREEDVPYDKVFTGNTNIFQETRNNFVRPHVIGRFFRIYPTPVKSEIERYSLQIGLFGCSANVIIPPPPKTTATSTPESRHITKSRTKTTTTLTPKKVSFPSLSIVETKANTTNWTPGKNDSNVITPGKGPGIIIPKSSTPSDGTEVRKPPNLNENSIIVIAIVAALAVTSILLAALVLILVRKRKKDPKDAVSSVLPHQQITDNNNTQFHFENKKSKKRRHKGGGHFHNCMYKDSDISATLQPQSALAATLLQQGATMPAERVGFLSNGHQNGTAPPFTMNGLLQADNQDNETDSFVTDDEHEYSVIPEDLPVSEVPSIHHGSSKASTGSSMGNKSRNSETMQRTWGTAGDQWNKGQFAPNSPVFFTPNHHPTFSSFSSGSHPHGAFPYPNNIPNVPQTTRAGTLPHDVHFSVSGGQFSDGSNMRRGSSQSPSRGQRHSSSSNNSSHSHPPTGVQSYTHEPQNPYYSSVPNGESNPVTALNHPGYTMNSDPTIPEQNEMTPCNERRKPSYKEPRQFHSGVEPPMLPEKAGVGVRGPAPTNGHRLGSDPAITQYNGMPGHSKSFSQSPRSDYDRLYRGSNSSSGPEIKNNFSIFNGSQSQYNQLNLNADHV